MKNKFTPGPWHVSQSKAAISPASKRVFRSIKDKQGIGGNIIANAFGGSSFALLNSNVETANANARLIAAAPEMYELLTQAWRELDHGYSGMLANQIEKLLTQIDNGK